MTKQIDFDKYALFVDGVTSDSSKDYQCFIESISSLDGKGANIHIVFLLLLLALVLKVVSLWRSLRRWFSKVKPWNDDNREHLIIELGDVMWYVMQACAALDVSIEDVVAGNVEKLKKRYPGGEFDVYKSENRAADDR